MSPTGANQLDFTRRLWVENPETGCWDWVASLDGKGYGRFNPGGGMKRAHRVSYEVFVGPIPTGRDICHMCDNKRCVNPDHLWAGTRKQNMLDASLKKRLKGARGERNRKTWYDADYVREMRAWCDLGYSQRDVAKAYGVDPSTLSRIYRRETWAHV